MDAEYSSNNIELLNDDEQRNFNDSYVSIPYGFQLVGSYLHASKHCDIKSITYNSKNNEYVILDSRGVNGWIKNVVTNRTKRLLDFESYKFNTLRDIIYCRSYNVYFASSKEYQLKVYNLNFHETFCVASDGTSVSCLMFNCLRNELVTAGRNCLCFWRFDIVDKSKSLQGIVLDRKYPVADSALITDAVFDEELQRVYLLCDYDIWCYTVEGRFIFHLKNTSTTFVSACLFSKAANLLIIAGMTGQITIFSPSGGLVTTLLNHSREVTALLVHPCDGNMFISASMDGTIKLFSLQMLEEIYSINVFPDGVHWMANRSNNILYCASRKTVKVFDLNYAFKFWSTIRSDAKLIDVLPKQHRKTSHVLACAKDNSIRLYSSRSGQQKCTVLPPPELSILDEVLSVAYDRIGNVIYLLFTCKELWIYSTKTDPATRVATWNIDKLIKNSPVTISQSANGNTGKNDFGISSYSQNQADQNVKCMCLSVIARSVYEKEEDVSDKTMNISFLLCGLSNGTIVFLDAQIQGTVFMHFKAHTTSPVMDIQVVSEYNNIYIMTLIQTIEHLLIRIWNTDGFHKLQEFPINDNIQSFALKDSIFAAGHKDGRLLIHKFDTLQQDITFLENRNQQNSNTNEHSACILSVDILMSKQLICSCGMDEYIRVWNYSKTLLCEVKLDDTLCYGSFLNSLGTILISFKSQLFTIPYNVLQISTEGNVSSADCSIAESFVYEDPFIFKELGKGTVLKETTLPNYLVPYPYLGLGKLWMLSKALSVHSGNDDDSEDEISSGSGKSIDSFAPTEIYQDTVYSGTSGCNSVIFPRFDGSPSPEIVEDVDSTESNISEKESLLEEDLNDSMPVKHQENSKVDLDIRAKIKSLLTESGQMESRSAAIQGKPKIKKSIKTSQNRFTNNIVGKRKIVKKQKKIKNRKEKIEAKKKEESSIFDDKNEELIPDEEENTIDAGGNISYDKSQEGLEKVELALENIYINKEAPDNAANMLTAIDQLHSMKLDSIGKLNQMPEDQNTKSGNGLDNDDLYLAKPNLTSRVVGVSETSISHSFKNIMNSLFSSDPQQNTIKEQAENIYNEVYWNEEVDDISTNNYSEDVHNITNSNSASAEQNNEKNISSSKQTVNTFPSQRKPRLNSSRVKETLKNDINRNFSATKERIGSGAKDTSKVLTKKKNEQIYKSFYYLNASEKFADVNYIDDSSLVAVPSFVQNVKIESKINSTVEEESTEVTDKSYVQLSRLSANLPKYMTKLKPTVPLTTVRFNTGMFRENQNINISTNKNQNMNTVIVDNMNLLNNNTDPEKKDESSTASETLSASLDIRKVRKQFAIMVLNAKIKHSKTNLSMRDPRKKKIVVENKSSSREIGNKENTDSIISYVSSANLTEEQGKKDEEEAYLNYIDVYEHRNQETTLIPQSESLIASSCSNRSIEHSKSISCAITESSHHAIESPQCTMETSQRGSESLHHTDLNVDSRLDIKPKGSDRNHDIQQIIEKPKEIVKQQVMNFILSAFKKSKTPSSSTRIVSPLRRKVSHSLPFSGHLSTSISDKGVENESDVLAFNFLDNQENSIHCIDKQESDVDLDYDNGEEMSKKRTLNNLFCNSIENCDENPNSFITPTNSTGCFDYMSVKSVTIRSTRETDHYDNRFIKRSNITLFEKLNKYRYLRQKERHRHHGVQLKRESRCSSGYGASPVNCVSPECFRGSVSRCCSADSSTSRRRLTVWKSPMHTEQSEESIYSYMQPQVLKQQNSNKSLSFHRLQRLSKIRNLEDKLSGQPHRFHLTKSAQQMKNDRVTLLFLKAKENGHSFLPITKTSVSIPSRSECKLDIKPTPPTGKRKYSKRYRYVSGH